MANSIELDFLHVRLGQMVLAQVEPELLQMVLELKINVNKRNLLFSRIEVEL